MPKELAYSFRRVEGLDMKLNRRLPRITHRDVLSTGRSNRLISGAKRQTTRRVVRGSRLFKKLCGHKLHREK
jgi:hypothetical protein